MKVVVGSKQKKIKIPKGYFLVTDGFCQKEDMFADISNPNKPKWSPTEEDDWGILAEGFDALIRKEEFCLS